MKGIKLEIFYGDTIEINGVTCAITAMLGGKKGKQVVLQLTPWEADGKIKHKKGEHILVKTRPHV